MITYEGMIQRLLSIESVLHMLCVPRPGGPNMLKRDRQKRIDQELDPMGVEQCSPFHVVLDRE
jgi:hypothetical protein